MSYPSSQGAISFGMVVVPFLKNSYKPSGDIWEATLLSKFSAAVSEILWYKQTHRQTNILLLYYMDTSLL